MRGASKREHCPKCKSTKVENLVHVEPGHDMEIFVECGECKEFVARYILKSYTGDDIYKSYLRMMHQRRMSTGVSTKKALEEFKEKLFSNYEKVKKDIKEHEETKRIEDLINEDK